MCDDDYNTRGDGGDPLQATTPVNAIRASGGTTMVPSHPRGMLVEWSVFRLGVRANQAGDDLDHESHESDQSDHIRSLAYTGCGFSHFLQGRAKVRGLIRHGGTPGK